MTNLSPINKEIQHVDWKIDKNTISRVKTTKSSEVFSTVYKVGKNVTAGSYGTIHILEPAGEGKREKIGKLTITDLSESDVWFKNFNKVISAKEEYEISCLWPKNEMGLLMRPKAFFPEFYNGSDKATELIVLHKYDNSLIDLKKELTGLEVVNLVHQVSHGLSVLHSLGVAHRDIGLPNIFIDSRLNRFDLADFGLSHTKEKYADNPEEFKDLIKSDVFTLQLTLKQVTNLLKKDNDTVIKELQAKGLSLESATSLVQFINNMSDAMPSAEEIDKIFQKIKENISQA